MPWWLWIVVAVAGIWLALFGFDLVSRQTFKTAVRFNRYYRRPGHSVLFVHLPGLAGDGATQIEPVMDSILAAGDLICVSHITHDGIGSERFCRNFMAWHTADKLAHEINVRGYRRVIFLGTSQGGKHAYRIGKLLEGRGIKTDKILIDSPRHWGDLPLMQQLLSPLMIALPFGLLWNRLSPRAMKFLFIPPDESTVEPGVDRRHLDATVAAAQASLLSYYRDQVVDIIRPTWMRSGDWSDCQVAYVWSQRGEDVVRGKRASQGWDDVAGGTLRIYKVDAKHAAYGENPGVYREVLPKVFRDMGL